MQIPKKFQFASARDFFPFKAGKNTRLIFFAAIVISFMLLLGMKSFLIFLLVAMAAGVLNYFLHISEFHIHLGHVSFLAVIFSYSLGFKYGVFMILIGHVLPEILAAHADIEMVITAAVYTLVSYIASVFSNANILFLGISLTFLQAVLTMALGKMAGTPVQELITEDGIEFVMNIFYFVSFSGFLVRLLG